MKKQHAFGLMISILLACNGSAAVFERDWKAPGDGLLTYDDISQRVWLDLSQTILSDQFPGADREAKYQNVVSQTATGGLFEGFTVAVGAEVIALAASAGVDTSTLDETVNATAALSLAQLLSTTYEATNGFKAAIGLVNEAPIRGVRPSANIQSGPTQAGITISPSHFQVPSPPGVMLFRIVPEPSTAILTYLVLVMVVNLRFSRR